MPNQDHWENVYRTKPSTTVGWYQPRAERSLALIQRLAPDRNTPILDVGGGASVLVDGLLDAHYVGVTVLDLSSAALATTRTRLGDPATQVNWLEGDVTQLSLPRQHFGLWHDRAVFHFLTLPEQRAAYMQQVRHALQPGAHVVIATFAEDGPEQCCGLPVVRYSAEALHAAFGEDFSLVSHERETHVTPAGASQAFLYCVFRCPR